jgi:hypothetical protein
VLIYLDLADEFWRCIEIGANGWRIAEDPPVRFRRSAGMQRLPLPLRGGSIEALAPFLNLASGNDLCSPSVAPVRALPRDERELFIAASNGHVLAFDNLSGPADACTACRTATPAGACAFVPLA